MRTQIPAPAVRARATRVPSRDETGNLAFAAQLRMAEALQSRRLGRSRANRTPDSILDDRRNHVAMTVTDERLLDSEQYPTRTAVDSIRPELVATAGSTRSRWCGVSCVRPNGSGRTSQSSKSTSSAVPKSYVMFEPEALDEAMATLDGVATEPAMENDVTRAEARVQAAHNAHEWDALRACFGDE